MKDEGSATPRSRRTRSVFHPSSFILHPSAIVPRLAVPLPPPRVTPPLRPPRRLSALGCGRRAQWRGWARDGGVERLRDAAARRAAVSRQADRLLRRRGGGDGGARADGG